MLYENRATSSDNYFAEAETMYSGLDWDLSDDWAEKTDSQFSDISYEMKAAMKAAEEE